MVWLVALVNRAMKADTPKGNMSKKGRSSYGVEVQKGPISVNEQFSGKLRREPEFTMRDIEDNFMRKEKMTLTLHTPKR